MDIFVAILVDIRKISSCRASPT